MDHQSTPQVYERPDAAASRTGWTVVTERFLGRFTQHSRHETETAARTAADGLARTQRLRAYVYSPERRCTWQGGTQPPKAREAPAAVGAPAPEKPRYTDQVNVKFTPEQTQAIERISLRADLWGGFRTDRSTVVRRAVEEFISAVEGSTGPVPAPPPAAAPPSPTPRPVGPETSSTPAASAASPSPVHPPAPPPGQPSSTARKSNSSGARAPARKRPSR